MSSKGPRRTVLVTGGTGYIGSHCTVALLEAGHEVLIADNLSNSRAEVFDRIEHLAGKQPAFERATGKKVPYRIVERRPGDAAICYADPGLAAAVVVQRNIAAGAKLKQPLAKLRLHVLHRPSWLSFYRTR